MKVIEGKFNKGDEENPEGPPTPADVCESFLGAVEELSVDEVVIIGRSSEFGTLCVLSNQNLVDQNFLFDAAKLSMFQNLLVDV